VSMSEDRSSRGNKKKKNGKAKARNQKRSGKATRGKLNKTPRRRPSPSPEPNWNDLDANASDEDLKKPHPESQRTLSNDAKSDSRGGKSEDDREDVPVTSGEELKFDGYGAHAPSAHGRKREQKKMVQFVERFNLHAIAEPLFDHVLTIDFLLFLSDRDLDAICEELTRSKIQQNKLKYAVFKTKEQKSGPPKPRPMVMAVRVEIADENPLFLLLTPSDTVGILKRKIQEKDPRYPMSKQTVINAKGEILAKNRRTLTSYGIDHASTVYLERFVAATRIFVKTMTGKSCSMMVRESDRVCDIKAHIQKERGIAIEKQTLLFAGKRLEDDKTLQFYKIADESTLHFCVERRTDLRHLK